MALCGQQRLSRRDSEPAHRPPPLASFRSLTRFVGGQLGGATAPSKARGIPVTPARSDPPSFSVIDTSLTPT